MNKKLIYIFVVLVSCLFVISACQQEAVGGRLLERNGGGNEALPNQIRANSCDADNICEVNILKGLSALTLNSRSGYIKIEGDELILTKSGAGQGVTFKSNDVGMLTITPHGVNAKIEGELKITGDLIIDGLEGRGNSYVCIDSNSRLFRSNNPCR